MGEVFGKLPVGGVAVAYSYPLANVLAVDGFPEFSCWLNQGKGSLCQYHDSGSSNGGSTILLIFSDKLMGLSLAEIWQEMKYFDQDRLIAFQADVLFLRWGSFQAYQ